MNDQSHIDAINKIAVRQFGREPDAVERMTTGICNEVYAVAIGGREYIFRLKDDPRYLLGSRNHIPLFRSKGISVPEILAEDYSMTRMPFAFQVQTKLPGRDLKYVIETLTDDELKAIGGEVANVFRQLSSVPNNGMFGVVWGDDKDLVPSWPAEVDRVIGVVRGWGKRTGVLDAMLDRLLRDVFKKYKTYFERVRPYTYFGDIAGKNVMIDNGRFTGLVDLDSLAQGDPLEAVGRIKASWYGAHHGSVYSEAVMDALGLPPVQREIVTMYALLNKIFWTLENGVQFNSNTRAVVDRDQEARDKIVVAKLAGELGMGAALPVPVAVPVSEAIAAQPVPIATAAPSAEPQPVATPVPPPVPVEQPIPTLASPPGQPEPLRLVRTEPRPPEPEQPLPMIEMPASEPEADPPVRETEQHVDEILTEVRQPAAAPRVENAQPAAERVVLEASGLSKTYVSDGLGFNALSNVDLKIAKGDCIAIVGKSGSGKSTLMHLLACLDTPTEGYVYVDGDDTSTMSESDKNMLRNERFGFVFQQFFLGGRDTVFENVVLPMRIRGASDDEMAIEAQAALAAVGLADKSDKRAKDLSGGEKQRVCIARALIGRPQVIFADEPTGNLDSNTGEAVEKLLFDLNREKGITLVIVTHDSDLAARCSRVVEMKDGRIVDERRSRGI